MRRKPGALVPLELEILTALVLARRDHLPECHGFQIAKLLQTGNDARLLTAHGTLYRALARLENMGLLMSRWEEPGTAANEGRPLRRLYRLTDTGTAAAATAERARRVPARRPKLARA
jgi:PadR family transcriptional regulator, regulatory protein PadR